MTFEVTYYSPSKGYGFLQCVEPGASRVSCFVHHRNIAYQTNLQVGDIVTADVVPSKDRPGRQDAVNVVVRKRDEVAKAAQ
jgi:cold shock CspA family protein